LARSARVSDSFQTTKLAVKVRHKLTNSYLEALRDFRDDRTVIVWDTDVRQLRATVGPRKTSFSFFQQHSLAQRLVARQKNRMG
jgi:hypothetical protein